LKIGFSISRNINILKFRKLAVLLKDPVEKAFIIVARLEDRGDIGEKQENI